MQGMPALFHSGRKALVFAIIAFIVCQALAIGATAFATRIIFASLYSAHASLPHMAFVVLTMATLVYSVFRIASRYFSEKLGQSYAIDFRKNFYTHLSRSPVSIVAERRVGALSIRFVGDLAAMRNWVSLGFTGVASAFIILPAAMLTLWFINPQYIWAVVLPITCAFMTMLVLGRRLKPVHSQLRKERANLAIDMMERVPVAPQMRLLGRASKDIKLLNKRGKNLLSIATQHAYYLESIKALPDIGVGMAGVLLLWFTASSGAGGANAAAGLAVLGLVAIPMRDLAIAWDLYCSWEIARDKSETVFDKPTLQRTQTGSELPQHAIKVCAKSLTIHSHAYQQDDTQKAHSDINSKTNTKHVTQNTYMQQIEELSFTVPAGQSLAISIDASLRQPLLNVLTTLDDPKAGNILLSDIPVSDISLNQLPKIVHYLTLSAPILQGSLRRTLTLGVKKRPNDAKLLRLIEKYQLTATMHRIGGLDGRVWEDGRNLCTDEKLKIFFIRALLSEPKYVVIDGTINQLNLSTKKLMVGFINKLQATRIVVTENKKLIESCHQHIELRSHQQTSMYQLQKIKAP